MELKSQWSFGVEGIYTPGLWRKIFLRKELEDISVEGGRKY
jgi:hypothetical protein